MEDTLLISKDGITVKDTVNDWNIAVEDMPYTPSDKLKELPTQDWADEHGEDTYIPENLMFEAFDWEITFCYKGDKETAYDKIDDFLTYLTTGGAELMIYSPYTKIGRQGCYLKETSDYEYWNRNGEDVVEFKYTFRVTDPRTQITL